MSNIITQEINEVRFSKAPALYLPFNDNAKDYSGNGNDGVVTGAILTTGRDGIANTAYNFSNTTDRIEVSNLLSTFEQTSNYAVSLWVYQTASAENMNVWNFGGGGSNRHNLNFSYSTIGFQRYNGTSYTGMQQASAIELNAWIHIVCVNSGGALSLYKNGVEIGSSGNRYAAAQSDNIFYLGYPGVSTNSSRSIQGKIAEVMVFGEVLTLTEVKILYEDTIIKMV